MSALKASLKYLWVLIPLPNTRGPLWPQKQTDVLWRRSKRTHNSIKKMGKYGLHGRVTRPKSPQTTKQTKNHKLSGQWQFIFCFCGFGEDVWLCPSQSPVGRTLGLWGTNLLLVLLQPVSNLGLHCYHFWSELYLGCPLSLIQFITFIGRLSRCS